MAVYRIVRVRVKKPTRRTVETCKNCKEDRIEKRPPRKFTIVGR